MYFSCTTMISNSWVLKFAFKSPLKYGTSGKQIYIKEITEQHSQYVYCKICIFKRLG